MDSSPGGGGGGELALAIEDLNFDGLAMGKIMFQLLGDGLSNGITRQGNGADKETLCVDKNEIGRACTYIGDDHAARNLWVVIAKAAGNCYAGGQHRGHGEAVIGKGVTRTLYDFFLSRSQHQLQVKTLLRNYLVIPNDVAEGVGDVLLSFKLNDFVELCGFDSRDFDEFP